MCFICYCLRTECETTHTEYIFKETIIFIIIDQYYSIQVIYLDLVFPRLDCSQNYT